MSYKRKHTIARRLIFLGLFLSIANYGLQKFANPEYNYDLVWADWGDFDHEEPSDKEDKSERSEDEVGQEKISNLYADTDFKNCLRKYQLSYVAPGFVLGVHLDPHIPPPKSA